VLLFSLDAIVATAPFTIKLHSAYMCMYRNTYTQHTALFPVGVGDWN